jgi:hypothetical protein
LTHETRIFASGHPLPHKENISTRTAKGAKGTRAIEFYHLAKDPLETKNLANANTERVAKLRKLIASEWKID